MAADGNPEINIEMQGADERKMGWVERNIFLQMELYDDENNDSSDTKRKKRMARAALTTWKENLEMYDHRILQMQSETRSITNEVYQLVGLYSVFEGVVLTAVATSSRLECQHLWSPVGLSLFASVNLVVVAFTKVMEIRDSMNSSEYNTIERETTLQWISILKTKGYDDFDFNRDCHSPCRDNQAPFWRNALGLTIPLTIFTAGLVFSLVHILCWS